MTAAIALGGVVLASAVYMQELHAQLKAPDRVAPKERKAERLIIYETVWEQDDPLHPSKSEWKTIRPDQLLTQIYAGKK